MKKRIFLSPPHMSGKELDFIHDAFEKNWIAPLGENVDKFEEALSNYLGIEYVAALSSGTAAIHLALINLGVKSGDEVLVSSLTFSGSVNPIIYQSAVPIFIDSEKKTWNMDPVLLEKAIKDRINKGRKPKAIILVHLYGMPALLDEILEVAAEYEIPVIEDAAEALGSEYHGRAVGTLGEMGILSFNGNKIITTSGGGALISNRKEYIENAIFRATQARDKAPHYQHSHVGYNYRMSNILAGIGRGQMEVLDEWVEKRRENYRFYHQELNQYDFINFLEEPKDTKSNYWLTTITFDSEKYDREVVREELEKENIESRPLWKPMHLQPVFQDYPAYENGTSESLFKKGLCLPSSSGLAIEDKERIINKLHKLFG